MFLQNLVHSKSVTNYQIGGVRLSLGRLYIQQQSDIELLCTHIPDLFSRCMNLLKTSLAFVAVEFSIHTCINSESSGKILKIMY